MSLHCQWTERESNPCHRHAKATFSRLNYRPKIAGTLPGESRQIRRRPLTNYLSSPLVWLPVSQAPVRVGCISCYGLVVSVTCCNRHRLRLRHLALILRNGVLVKALALRYWCLLRCWLRCIVAVIEILSYFSNVVNYEISILEINLNAKNRKWKVFMLSRLRIYYAVCRIDSVLRVSHDTFADRLVAGALGGHISQTVKRLPKLPAVDRILAVIFAPM